MNTLDLQEAAKFLGLHPNTLQARAKAGEIPGAKIGKEWRFLDVDLAEYIRSQYPANKVSDAQVVTTEKLVQRNPVVLNKPRIRNTASELDELLVHPSRKQK